MRPLWRFGALPEGSATELAKVVREVGEDEAVQRFANYCERVEPRFASVHRFVTTHAMYATGADEANGKPRQLAAVEMLL